MSSAIHRELPEPTEADRPLPWPLLALVLVLTVFAVYYTLNNTNNLAVGGGDWRSPVSPQVAAVDGESLFKTHCTACHQATGLGIAQVFPPLVESEWVVGSPERLAAILLLGINGEIEVKGQTYRGQMPAFGSRLSQSEIAALATYIRSSWGNSAPPVEAELVEQVQNELGEREEPWNGGQELRTNFD